MAKRTQHSSRARSVKTQRKTPTKAAPERLSRTQIAHELGELGEQKTVAAISRRTGIPQSTLWSWIKKGRVSKRGLARSRKALPPARALRRVRKAPKPAPPPKRKPSRKPTVKPKRRRAAPPKQKRRTSKAQPRRRVKTPRGKPTRKPQKRATRADAVSAVHLAFATGIDPVLEGSTLTRESFDKIAAAIAKGKRLPSSPKITGSRLESIREACFDANEADTEATQNAGFDYRRPFEPTAAGQGALSEAWIRELKWVFERRQETPDFFAIFDDAIVSGYRFRGTWFTSNATSMWQIAETFKPPGYWGITYEPLSAEEYEVKLWIKDSQSKSRKRKKKS